MEFPGTTILGLDPAIASIGYAVIRDRTVVDYGVIKTLASDGLYDRLKQIHSDVAELCQLLKPQMVALEMPFFTRENTNANKVLRALGVIELALGDYGLIEPVFLHQSQVKATVSQYGAQKQEVQQAVAEIFGLATPPKPDDAADALAIAYAAQMGVRANVR